MEETQSLNSTSVNETDAELKSPPEVFDEKTEETKYENKSEPATPTAESESILYNAKALNKHDETYRLEDFKKNYMMVFNQRHVEGLKPRLGTEKDVASLRRTFQEYNFEIDSHNDLTRAEIMEKLQIFKEKDFTDYGCIVVTVLTHGTYGGILRAKDMQYREGEIINFFKSHKNPSLVTKPKILIVQACRGEELIAGTWVKQRAKIHTDVDRDEVPYTLPIESDMLILHSSYHGNPSHRDTDSGSWLIQTLCSEIKKHSGSLDFESIITEVKRRVAIDMSHEVYNRLTLQININKQMPVTTSTLIRKLYLRKFESEPSSGLSTPEVFSDAGIHRDEVLDPPSTPLLLRVGPCTCFLDHFAYFKKCLRYFVSKNSDDTVVKSYLDLCETYEDGSEFFAAKEKFVTVISEYFARYEGTLEFYDYLYLYKKPSHL